MRQQGGGLTEVRTARLVLRVPTTADVPELHDLYADPRVWRDDPVTRHDTVAQTTRMVRRWRAAWARDDLGMWVARGGDDPDEPLVGIGGCSVRAGLAWNLGFRLGPGRWGAGFAQEIARAGMEAARQLRPELPLTAYLLEGNARSRRSTERTGMRLVWRGPDAGNPDPAAVRLLYADRELAPQVVEALVAG